MARTKKADPTTTKQTRKRRDLAERVKSFDTEKLLALKVQAEDTIRLIAAEGARRQFEFTRLQDTSILAKPVETVEYPIPAGVKYPSNGASNLPVTTSP